MRLKGKYRGKFYPLPEGYDLRKADLNKRGFISRGGYVICNRKIKRYLWNPERNCVFYEPTTKIIYRFMDWNEKSPAGLTSSCGFGKICKLKGGKSQWVDLTTVLNCIPLEKI